MSEAKNICYVTVAVTVATVFIIISGLINILTTKKVCMHT